jgi:peptide deformylase
MSVKPIILWPDPVLKQFSAPVPPVMWETAGVDKLLDNLFETMYYANGVGLSAIQLGVPLRVFTMDCNTGLAYAFINPIITGYGGALCKVREGCLSLPNLFDEVERYPEVTVEYTSPDKKRHTQLFTGLEAQCVQHEYDHLDGIVFPDHLSPLKRQLLTTKMLKRKGKNP